VFYQNVGDQISLITNNNFKLLETVLDNKIHYKSIFALRKTFYRITYKGLDDLFYFSISTVDGGIIYFRIHPDYLVKDKSPEFLEIYDSTKLYDYLSAINIFCKQEMINKSPKYTTTEIIAKRYEIIGEIFVSLYEQYPIEVISFDIVLIYTHNK
jgi:hypothetical protein